MGAGALVASLIARPSRGFLAWSLVLGIELLVVSFLVNPAIDQSRSGAALMRTVEAATTNVRELGVVAYKEQYLLQTIRPIVNFGHARWREGEQEMFDAAAWQAQSPGRVLLMDESSRARCFSSATAKPMRIASGEQWYLVETAGDSRCITQGHANVAIEYIPPVAASH
jgi:hypothetical protein